MAEPNDMILPLLRDMREDMRMRFDAVDKRLDKIEAAQKSFKHALTADTMMSKLVAGEFEERIEAWERDVEALKAQRPA